MNITNPANLRKDWTVLYAGNVYEIESCIYDEVDMMYRYTLKGKPWRVLEENLCLIRKSGMTDKEKSDTKLTNIFNH